MTIILGSNLGTGSGVNRFDPQIFSNLFKQAFTWATINAGGARNYEEATLWASHVDVNGYPTSVSFGTTTKIATSVLGSIYAPAGIYVFLYDGTGTFATTDDLATVVAETAQDGSAGTGRIIFNNPSPTADGASFRITSTAAAPNHARNFRLVHAPTLTVGSYSTPDPNEAIATEANAGDLSKAFTSEFLATVQNYKTLRFMDWLNANNSTGVNATDITPPDWFSWVENFNKSGIPIEVCVALCNKINADGWITFPINLSDAGVTAVATTVHSNLNSNLKMYFEFGNEIWNNKSGAGAYNTFATTYNNGTYFSGGPYSNGQIQHAMGIVRTLKSRALVRAAFDADAARSIVVVNEQSAQIGPAGTVAFVLGATTTDLSYIGDDTWTGTVADNIDALAVSYYWGNVNYDYPIVVPDETTLDQLFQEIFDGGYISGGYPGGWLKQAKDWYTDNCLRAYNAGLPDNSTVIYEGGQAFVAGENTALHALFTDTNSDARMGTAYTQMLDDFYATPPPHGGEVFCHYYERGDWTKYGYWGALRSFSDTSSPKYVALMDYMGVSSGDILLSDYVLDHGLASALADADQIWICRGRPTTYAEATTGSLPLGSKSGAAGSIFGAVSAATGGRKVTLNQIIDGTVSVADVASYFAVVDSAAQRLLVSGPFQTARNVTVGVPFSIAPFDITLLRA